MINDEMKWSLDLSIITRRLDTIIIRITHNRAYDHWNTTISRGYTKTYIVMSEFINNLIDNARS